MGGKGSGSDRENRRLQKINEILTLIKKEKQTKKFVIANIMIKYGTARRTAGEYVNVLINARKIKEVEGILRII